jgi:hypothetical protein
MVLSKHIKVIGLGILILWPVFLSQTHAQGECKPHKRVVKAVEKKLGESLEIDAANHTVNSTNASEFLHPGDCIFRITSQEEIQGYLLSTSAKGRFDHFDYSVIFSEDKAVLQVIVTVYRSSQGAAICQKNWLSQFEGYKGGGLELGSDIDAVSGGTISATSMVKDIQRCHLLISSLELD